MLQQIIFQVIIFFANTIQTITGFAGTLIAMPFSIRIVGIEEAKTVLNIFTLAACLIITIQNRQYVNKNKLWKMVLGMLIGMMIGVWIFERCSLTILLQLYAILIILVALKKIFIKKEIQLPQWFLLIVLVLAGVVHGIFLSGGALLVIYAVSNLKSKDEFRATIAPVWVILNSFLIFSHAKAGYYTKTSVIAIIFSLIPLVFSVIVGNILYKKIKQKTFLDITNILLLIAGVSLII